MNTNAREPVMYWDSENLINLFRFFKQRCKLYFSLKNILAEKQVDHILLLARKDSEDTMLGRLSANPTEQTQKLFGENLKNDWNLKLISVLHDFICVNISRRT